MDQPQPGNDSSAGVELEVQRLHSENAEGMLRYGLSYCGSLETAQDAVQETFLEYFVARSSGRRIEDPKIWLYRVLRTQLRATEASGNKRAEVGLDATLPSADPLPGQDNVAGEMDSLWSALKTSLAPRELECLKLRTQGLRYIEIAEVLGLRCGTVGALLVRAHKKLRSLARQSENDDAAFTLIEKVRNLEWKQ